MFTGEHSRGCYLDRRCSSRVGGCQLPVGAGSENPDRSGPMHRDRHAERSRLGVLHLRSTLHGSRSTLHGPRTNMLCAVEASTSRRVYYAP